MTAEKTWWFTGIYRYTHHFQAIFLGCLGLNRSVPYLPYPPLFQDDELSYALGKQGGTRKKLERASGESFGKDIDVPWCA